MDDYFFFELVHQHQLAFTGQQRGGDAHISVAGADVILANYDEMDTATIEKILTIFRRVNKIDEKEEKLKNMERTRKAAV